jgi:hypothetical protein
VYLNQSLTPKSFKRNNPLLSIQNLIFFNFLVQFYFQSKSEYAVNDDFGGFFCHPINSIQLNWVSSQISLSGKERKPLISVLIWLPEGLAMQFALFVLHEWPSIKVELGDFTGDVAPSAKS